MQLTRRTLLTGSLSLAALAGLAACSGNEASGPTMPKDGKFPPGKLVMYGYGNPQWRTIFYNRWLEQHADVASGVTVETVQTEGEAQARQKLVQAMAASDFANAADVVQTQRVSLIDMARNGILVDYTDYLSGLESQLVPGALSDSAFEGRLYGMPESVRPQVLFYNKDILDRYTIDPADMSTFEGYLEVGRKLKTDSKGAVQLSHLDPGSYAWRYWGRRGLMPQAKARIWDDDGEIVLGDDEGTRKALGYLSTLHAEKHLYVTKMFQAPQYDAIKAGKIATFYIGAFLDEFLRANVAEMKGAWRVMNAPTFDGIGVGGAPVIGLFAAVKKPEDKYSELWRRLWHDFQFDGEARKVWTDEMVKNDAPYANPIVTELLQDPYWKEPSEFYGGQSFREAEAKGLENPSENLRVTADDAEADSLISAELEKYIAGAQTIDAAIAAMQAALKSKIQKTDPA